MFHDIINYDKRKRKDLENCVNNNVIRFFKVTYNIVKRNYHCIARLRRKGTQSWRFSQNDEVDLKSQRIRWKKKGEEKGQRRKESRGFPTLATFPETRVSILACLFNLLVRFFPRERQKSKTKRYHKNRLTSSQDDSSAPATWYPQGRPLLKHRRFFIVDTFFLRIKD